MKSSAMPVCHLHFNLFSSSISLSSYRYTMLSSGMQHVACIFYIHMHLPTLQPRSSWRVYESFRSKHLKGFFHGSAHARVLRNLICVPARNKANF